MKPILFFDETRTVLERMKQAQLTLGAAESCTGGLFSQVVTSVPGASDVFWGAVIAYSNHVKESQLNVSTRDLESFGAVSKEVALAMAAGARQSLKVDVAVSTTGIAGPGGGSPNKPIGTVWIGIASELGVSAKQLFLAGDREAVRQEAVRHLLKELSGLLDQRSVK